MYDINKTAKRLALRLYLQGRRGTAPTIEEIMSRARQVNQAILKEIEGYNEESKKKLMEGIGKYRETIGNELARILKENPDLYEALLKALRKLRPDKVREIEDAQNPYAKAVDYAHFWPKKIRKRIEGILEKETEKGPGGPSAPAFSSE